MTFNPNSNCSRCGKKSLLTDEVTGEQFCGKCGFVISGKVDDSGPEQRSFSTQGGVDTTRTGSPISLTRHDKGLATVINPANRDFFPQREQLEFGLKVIFFSITQRTFSVFF